MLVGYARVSCIDGSQRLDLQLDALKKVGIQKDNIYVDKIHAAYTDLENSHHKPAYTVSSNKLHDYLTLTDYMKTYGETIAANEKLSKATSKIAATS